MARCNIYLELGGAPLRVTQEYPESYSEQDIIDAIREDIVIDIEWIG